MNMYQALPNRAGYPRSMIMSNGTIAQFPAAARPMVIPQTAMTATPLQITQLQPNGLQFTNGMVSSGPQIQVLDENQVEYSKVPFVSSNNSSSMNNDFTNVMMVSKPSRVSRAYRGRQKWSWCSTVWSAISFILFASFCGFIGLLCAIHSYVDHKTGDYTRSRYKSRCSFIWAGVGIIFGILGVVAVVLIFVVYYEDLVSVLSLVGYGAPAWLTSGTGAPANNTSYTG